MSIRCHQTDPSFAGSMQTGADVLSTIPASWWAIWSSFTFPSTVCPLGKPTSPPLESPGPAHQPAFSIYLSQQHTININSEHTSTLVHFLQQVPRSSKCVSEDNDYMLMSVVLFKRVVDDFKAGARSKGYQVRTCHGETWMPIT